MAEKKEAPAKVKPKGMKVQIKVLTERLKKYTHNLDMLKLYFREYGILEHYLAWYSAMANEKPIPPKLILPKLPKDGK